MTLHALRQNLKEKLEIPGVSTGFLYGAMQQKWATKRVCAFLAALMAWECEMLANLRALARTAGEEDCAGEEGAPTVMRRLQCKDAGGATWQVVLRYWLLRYCGCAGLALQLAAAGFHCDRAVLTPAAERWLGTMSAAADQAPL